MNNWGTIEKVHVSKQTDKGYDERCYNKGITKEIRAQVPKLRDSKIIIHIVYYYGSKSVSSDFDFKHF